MIKLGNALLAWPTLEFKAVLKDDLESLEISQLPLQQGLSQSSYVSGNDFSVMIINVAERESSIVAKAGVFYSGVIAGCNCSDDPTPVDEVSEYCEVEVDINKLTAEARIILLKG